MPKSLVYRIESGLCAAFIKAAQERWTCYAETEGWDILAVRKDNGVQLGIEAKLTLNAKVVRQALPARYDHAVVGPHFRAVLVPLCAASGEIAALCAALGIDVIRMYDN